MYVHFLVDVTALSGIYYRVESDIMGKKKAAKDKKSVPVVVRLNTAEYGLVEKRASALGMNVSTFLRLLIRKGRIELDEGEHTL
jgi:hypothetical protein